MDDSVQKSCWGVTAWAVGAFAACLALGLLFDDAGAGDAPLAMAQAVSAQ